MRIESQFAAKDGGFYHFYDEEKPKPEVVNLPKRSAPKKVLDFEGIMKRYNFSNCEKLAENLGVDEKSLYDLNFFWLQEYDSYAAPMRDGENKIIGIHLRCEDGSKKAITGSKNGLFCPQIEPQKIAYICEGASNTAALLTLGFYAIGRPSCNTGGDILKVCLKRLEINRVVIVADNDCIKNHGGRPGQDGAKKLKKELGLMSVLITTPNPIKDCRELLQKIGIESARNYINNLVASKVWTKV